MLTLKDYNGKILVQYKRTKKRNLKGVVVAIGPNILGWSLCSSTDVFNKQKAIQIAIARALKSKELSLEARFEYYRNIPFSLDEIVDSISNRAKLYFKTA